MKKFFFIIISILLAISILTLNVEAEEGINWYIKKNGHKTPEKTKEASLVEKYGGIYIDKAAVNKKILYLTFDAGYENGNIEKTLNILKEKNVKAAFFILEYLIHKNEDLVIRMAKDGHTVCNHTKNHKDMTTLTDLEMKNNLETLDNLYKIKTGCDMAGYFRFPEGKFSERTIEIANNMGYKSVFWSFAYPDWDNDNQPDIDYAYNLIINNTHNGEIILLHPTSSTNAAILPKLIDKWREMGYEFGTLDMIQI